MKKNKKDKIKTGYYILARKTKRINGKTIFLNKKRLNPVAALFSIAAIMAVILVSLFIMPPSYNSITYNRFITQNVDAKETLIETKENRVYKAMVVLEQKTGRQLTGYQEAEKLPMASTTKIMTAIVAIESGQDLNKKHIVPSAAVGIEGSSMYLKKGEEFSLNELLYGLMLPSGNDAATAIAIIVGGSEENFVNLMNQKAKEIGATNTNFTNPHGLHSDNHYTTAKDLAQITRYAMNNEVFKEIVKTPTMVINKTQTNAERIFKNKQKLMKDEELKKCGIKVTGVKTGFTPEAGRCLVTSATTETGLDVIVVVLNAPKMFEATAEVLKEINNKYSMYSLLTPKEHISSISVVGSKKKDVKIYHNATLELPLTVEEKAKIKINYNYDELLVAPVKQEQVVGTIEVMLDDKLLYSSPIQTLEEAPNITIFSIIKEVIENFN